MRIELFRRIEELGEERWGALSNEVRFYFSYEWLSSVQGALAPECYYLTAWEGDRLLAGIPSYLVSDPQTYFFYNPAELLLSERIGQTLAPFLDPHLSEEYHRLQSALSSHRADLYPALISAAPYGYVSSICSQPGLSPQLP